MKPKILIVDDDVTITQQLFWTLCEEFDVMTANNLASAIRRATAYEPDAAILDLHLPPTPDTPDTGLRILDFVKHHLPATKVFVASTDDTAEVRRELTRLGADGFLPKPLDIEGMLAAVRRALAGRRLAVA
jgi:DNA-binding NarL/FixJ family response regulator